LRFHRQFEALRLPPAPAICEAAQMSAGVSAWPTDRPPILIGGPTATGKTAVAVALAERIGGEIVNADSMQVYVGLDIGAAKPAPEERARARFHLLDVAEPAEQFNVARWKQAAETAIAEIAARGAQVIVCGGTGLYHRALLDNWSLASAEPDTETRERLKQLAGRLGAGALHAMLQQADPEAAKRVHPNDTVRILRALEVLERTGARLSDLQAKDRQAAGQRPARCFALTMCRPALYERIDARVDAMVAAGLIEEVRQLFTSGCTAEMGAMHSLGYREIGLFLGGAMSLEAAIAEMKRNTRRFAKRQLTWFRADPRYEWIEISAAARPEEIAEIVLRPPG
jgi:tRNA dimethylallyltransferase